jgi:hypothetical protein
MCQAPSRRIARGGAFSLTAGKATMRLDALMRDFRSGID